MRWSITGWSGNARVGVSFGKLWLMGLEGTAWTDKREPAT